MRRKQRGSGFSPSPRTHADLYVQVNCDFYICLYWWEWKIDCADWANSWLDLDCWMTIYGNNSHYFWWNWSISWTKLVVSDRDLRDRIWMLVEVASISFGAASLCSLMDEPSSKHSSLLGVCIYSLSSNSAFFSFAALALAPPPRLSFPRDHPSWYLWVVDHVDEHH